MNNLTIAKLSDLKEEYKEAAAQLFVESFYNLYTSVSKDKKVLQKLFLSSLEPSLVYVAVYDNYVRGFMGISIKNKRTMHFDKIKCIELFGKAKGTIIYKQLGYLLEKPNIKNDMDVCLDYIATDKEYRGKGIASKLIEYAFHELGYQKYYIEVASKNIAAKRLYEHSGFSEYKRSFNPVMLIKGQGYVCKMEKTVVV